MSEDRDLLKAVFSPTPECPSLDALLEAKETAGPQLAQQVEECPRCLGEVALYEEFIGGTVGPELDAEILRRIDSRLPTAPTPPPNRMKSWLESLLRPAVWGPAAVAFAGLLAVIGFNLQQNIQVDTSLPVESVERGQTVELLAPKGEIIAIPADLRWNLLAVAVSYRVKLMEVDRNVIWETETKAANVSLPSDIRKKVLPGKRLIWSVEALGRKGEAIGLGTQDFRRAIVQSGVRNNE